MLVSYWPKYAPRLKDHSFVDSVNNNFVCNLFLSLRFVPKQSEIVLWTSSFCVCMWMLLCLSVCLGVKRFNFSTTSLIFHKCGVNFLPLDGKPTLCCLLSFPQPVVRSSYRAGLRIFEVRVTLACFMVVASLWSSLVLTLVTVHRLHRQHSLYVSVVIRVVPTLNAFSIRQWFSFFMHKLMVRYIH